MFEGTEVRDEGYSEDCDSEGDDVATRLMVLEERTVKVVDSRM